MTAQIITDPPRPGTPEWRGMITASKVPVILGLSPWQSPYRLAAEMMGLIEPEEISPQKQDMFLYGHAAELSMAYFWSKKNPEWDVSDGEVALTEPDLPFPNLVTVDRLATHKETGERRILEMKTVNSFDQLAKWRKPGEPHSVPANYEAQHLFQKGVSGIHEGEVLVQAMGAPESHNVTWDALLFARIVKRCNEFYNLLQEGTLPNLDDTTSTYETVRGLHPDIERDTVYVATREEALALFDAKEAADNAEAKYKGLRTQLLDNMGNRHRAITGDTVFARRQAGRGKTPEFRLVNKAREELDN